MSRIHLKGEGKPNPEFVFPEPGIDSTLPPLTLNLPHGIPFLPQPYIDLGYTHYEVWCVGAAGGRGGDGGSRYGIYNAFNDPVDPALLTVSWPYYFVGSVQHWHDPYLTGFGSPSVYVSFPNVWGGGGGGGGLHVVSGLLLALPDECSVVVGQAGENATPGQIQHPNPITPSPPYSPGSINDTPGITFYPPVAGEDGEASIFNDGQCKASGGKGGNPGAQWVSNKLMYEAKGGDGGVGNQTIAGGGGAGSATENNGADGTWNGTIGKGGGGGRGAMLIPENYH